jgi:Bacterial TniB protein
VVVSADYSHLHSATRPLAEENSESRIRRIRTDRWIAYSRAEAALSAMDDLLTFPKRTRMPNLLLVGPTNNGKTMIVEKFRRAHPPIAASATQRGPPTFLCSRCRCPLDPMSLDSSVRSSMS